MKRFYWTALSILAFVLTAAMAEKPMVAPAVAQSLYEKDFANLTVSPHRLSGTPFGIAAEKTIEASLRDAGITDILPIDIDVWQTKVRRCDIVIGSEVVNLEPMRCNLVMPPATPLGGLSGKLIYVGNGDYIAYGNRNVSGSIVAMEYDSRDNWRKAFALGAKAVVFLGGDVCLSNEAKSAGIPSNLVRLYASPQAQAQFDFRKDYDVVTITCHMKWERVPSRNICAFLPGTNPEFVSDQKRREAIVLSANYDSYGDVPTISPNARGAANVAAVLEAVRYFKVNRPRRDMIFMFYDNQARFHEGARSVYDAIMTRPELALELAKEHGQELTYTRSLSAAIEKASKGTIEQSFARDMLAIFKGDAENASTGLNQTLMRIRSKEQKSGSSPDVRRAIDTMDVLYARWNKVREAIAAGTIERIEQPLFQNLVGIAQNRTTIRLNELARLTLSDEQGATLRQKCASRFIVLHVSYDFSDQGTLFGPMLGDFTDFGYSQVVLQSGDNPSHYGRLFRVLSAAATATPGLDMLDKSALSDATMLSQNIPARIITSNNTAGTFGIYNLSLTTYHDGRIKEAQPFDTPDRCNSVRIAKQASQANRLLYTLAGQEGLALPRVFADNSFSKVPRWSDGKTNGYYVGLSLSGSIAENSPAQGALVMITKGGISWETSLGSLANLGRAGTTPGFDRFLLEQANAAGRFKLSGVRKDYFASDKSAAKNTITIIPVIFDSLGNVDAIVNYETIGTIDGVAMFPAKGFVTSESMGTDRIPGDVISFLQADGDAPFRKDQALFGARDGFGFLYVHKNTSIDRIKIFRPTGVVYLGATPSKPYGAGFPLTMFVEPPEVDNITASDIWQLNEARLSILRSKGVTSTDLELLQNHAKVAVEKGSKAPDVVTRVASFAQSSSVSRLLYNPVKDVMNDLINAVVILLLLAIPFAFALERLLICATSIYARLGGFAALFTATFALMYWMHPGFKIASAPLIVFLAFAIILLTSLVIFIMMRKFKMEIMALQGKSSGLHQSDNSSGGTLIAAVNMGMSTMRRRPVRTLLTCITVVMLTFTILCFSSLTNVLGVRGFYEGSASPDAAATFLVHSLDYRSLSPELPDMLVGRGGPECVIAPQWWLSKSQKSTDVFAKDRPFDIAAIANGKSAFVSGILGLTPIELAKWPALQLAFSGDSLSQKQTALQGNGVFLTRLLADQLGIVPGDSLAVYGCMGYLAGYLDVGRLQKLKNLDAKPILPVDFTDAAYAGIVTSSAAGALVAGGAASSGAQKDYTRLNSNQVAIMGQAMVQKMGGTLNAISMYPSSTLGSADEGKRIAEVTRTPVWTRGKEGVERMVFTKTTEVNGMFALIIPILLGGLIIFGTLLGSISDRQKEIYTFSALGLSPGHVGFLFLAEAAVYAVIGGLGGQLLAQTLALVATSLANMGYIQQPSINFSSTNSLFAIAMVMATVLISAIYPAIQASKSANPGVQRNWKMPLPQGDVLSMKFPFTVSAYDITGVVSFLAEHFREHDDAGLGLFATENVLVGRNKAGNIMLSSQLSLAPFDLGIMQTFELMAAPSEIEGIDEVQITTKRISGAVSDWTRANKTFMHDLRKQFLLWRTLSTEAIESYRMATLEHLGEESPKVA